VHRRVDRSLTANRVEGVEFDEILYADDTVCIAGGVRQMKGFLRASETEGERHGMRLSKTKYELLIMGKKPTWKVRFSSGDEVPVLFEVKYLGCY